MTDIVERRDHKGPRENLQWKQSGATMTAEERAVQAERKLAEAAAEIERLRAAVAAEREECAYVVQVFQEEAMRKAADADHVIAATSQMVASLLPHIAAAIRARGNFSSESDKKLHEGE